MVDINNPANYKPCRKKQFEVWACRPPIGTVTVDHLTQSRGSAILRSAGITANLISSEIIQEWKAQSDTKFQVIATAAQQGLVSVVDSPRKLVLCGTEGQFYVADYNFVAMQYSVFSNNSYISLNAIPELATKQFDWRRIRARQDYAGKTMACFVPVSQSFMLGSQIVNGAGVPHGKGDFIVCNKLANGGPDLNSRWVVNGLIFSDTYNNTGWTDVIQIGRQGVIEMPPSVMKSENAWADISTILDKAFFIPSIKKSRSGNKYRLDTSGMAVLVEKIKAGIIIKATGFGPEMFEGSEVDATIDFIKKSRFYYKFMYLALIEQFKQDGLLRRPDFCGDFKGFVSKSNTKRHFALLLDLYKALKAHNWKLDTIEFGELDGDWDIDTRYCIQEGFVFFSLMCTKKEVEILVYNDSEDSEYNYEGDPYDCAVEMKDGCYPRLKSELAKAYKEVTGSVGSTNVFINRLRELGFREDVIIWVSKFFNSNKCSLAVKRRGYNLLRWANGLGVVDPVYANMLVLDIYMTYEGKEYSIVLDNTHGELSEYSIEECVNGGNYKNFVYRDEQSFVRAVKSMGVKAEDTKLHLPTGEQFFFIDKGWFGFASKNDKVVIRTDASESSIENAEIACIQSIFATLYQTGSIQCYDSSYDQFDDLVSYADYLPPGDFAVKVFACLDKVISRAGYNLRSDPQAIVVEKDRSAAKFELYEKSTVTGQIKGYVYCPMFDIKLPFSCSASTWTAIEPWAGTIGGRVVHGKFSKLHYHQLQLRAGNYLNLYDFKRLRLEYLKENERVYGGVLDKKFAVGACNYNQRYEKDRDFSGVYIDRCRILLINSDYHQLQDARRPLSYHTRCTLIHEMGHFYTVWKWGTVHENPGEDGGAYYGISDKYQDQWFGHGKHFGEAIQLAADATGLPFNDIFGYDIGESSKQERESWNSVGKGSAVKTTSVISALDNGKCYRSYIADRKSLFICKTCGQVDTTQRSCHGVAMSSIGEGLFVTRCKQCGDIHVFSEVIDLPDEICSDYYSPIDVVGMLSVLPCQRCGGSVESLAPGLSTADAKEYMSDFRFTTRYKEHFHSIASKTLGKYNKWFMRVADCEVSMHTEQMPCIRFDILGSSFEEYYKLFFMCGTGKFITGALYRDYGQNAKGYLIHKFRLRTDTDIVKFMDYFMSYVRKDFKTT